MSTVTLETKTWQGDLHVMLQPERIATLTERCGADFAVRRLVVNNVDDPTRVMARAQRLVRDGVIDEVVWVEEHIGAALAAFGIDRAALGPSYVYSSAELVGLHLATTPYLVHFASDTTLPTASTWVVDGISLLDERPDVAVVNPAWTPDPAVVEAECPTSEGVFRLGYGFSDQCYLVRTADLASPIYHYDHPASERYPSYGGVELFERRVDAWMRTHERLRAVHVGTHYVHENIARPTRWQRVWGRHP